MTELEKKIEKLKNEAAMLEFGTYEQWQKAQPIREEIKKLNHGRKGWVAECYITDERYSHKRSYIMSDGSMSDDPTYYESEKESGEAIAKAGLEEGFWHTESKYMEGRE